MLNPARELRFYEHVRSTGPVGGLVEDLMTPIWKRLGAGCRPNRRTVEAIDAAGFDIGSQDRFRFRPVRFGPSSDHVIGIARKRTKAH